MRKLLVAVVVAMVAASTVCAQTTRTWDGTTGNWSDGSKWTGSTVPQAGEAAIINGGSVLLAADTADLASLTMGGGTLTCTNWSTRILATNVTITAGTVTLPGPFPDGGMSNRVWIVCSNDFTLGSNATVDADGKGFDVGNGEGAGTSPGRAGGGAYGGRGGRGKEGALGGSPYGLPESPLAPGSGGGEYSTLSGAGGGAVRIVAGGTAEVNGTITANGVNGGHSRAGAGSGGAVYITCGTFTGSSQALLSVAGGNGGTEGGAGGGGRIAIDYDTLGSPHAARFSASPGSGSRFYGSRWDFLAAMGTLWLSDTGVLSSTLTTPLFTDVRLFFENATAWSVGSLAVSNCSVTFAGSNFQLSVTGEATIGAGGVLGIGDPRGDHGATLLCGGDLTVQDGGELSVYSGMTNGTTEYGALVSVTGSLSVGAGSWVHPYSHMVNGGSGLFRVGSLSVADGGGFDANARGFGPAEGPGVGTQGGGRGGGGGYGGHGGSALGVDGSVGPAYGSTNAPAEPGSGGVSSTHLEHGPGGGLVRVEVAGAAVLNGAITANGGQEGSNYKRAGAGSGGGVFLTCEGNFSAGPSSVLQAAGGDSGNGGGGGGGGRIAVWHNVPADKRASILGGGDEGQVVTNTFAGLGTLSVTNGIGWADYNAGSAGPIDYAQTGTVLFLTVPSLAPDIENDPPTNVTTTTAYLNGHLVATSGSPVTVSVYWGSSDGGSITSGLWDDTNTWSQGAWAEGSHPTYQATGLTENAFYYYRYHAQNAGATDSAATSEVFMAGNVWVTAPDPDAEEVGQDPGVFTVQRAGTATNESITVNYTYGGTASAGDFTAAPVGASVILPAGVASTNVTVTPEEDTDGTEGDETVVLILQPGGYAVGLPASNTITIADEPIAPGLNTTTNSGGWDDRSVWSLGRKPVAGDDVVVSNAVTVSNATELLKSFLITNTTLTFVNWDAALYASNVVIAAGATVTLPPAFTNGGISNRVWIVCSDDFTLEAGAVIDVDGKGFDSANGEGAGVAGARAGGGGYGGGGGRGREAALGGEPYGEPESPSAPGSGGGLYGVLSGAGGGAVRISAGGTATIDGTITANGIDVGHYRAGAGSGGAVYITCATFEAGSQGVLRANGGNGGTEGGAGGGGRIAVDYDVLGSPHDVRFSASAGTGGHFFGNRWDFLAGMGTLWLPDTGVLSDTLAAGRFTDVRLFVETGSWSVGSLSVSNCSVTFAGSNFQLSVTGHTTIGTNGVLGIGDRHGDHGAEISCGGDLTLQDGGELRVYSGATNGTAAYGALVDVTGGLTIGAGSWVYPHSHQVNGGSALFRAGSLSIAENGGFNGDARGFGPGEGHGRGVSISRGGGGGYGGHGGAAQGNDATIGPAYGSSNAPALPGSGGATSSRDEHGPGGGLVRIEVGSGAVLDGTITADGGVASWRTGAGSGGGVFLACEGLFSVGPNSVLQAEGGDTGTEGGGGGGGRIAVWYKVPSAKRATLLGGGDVSQIVTSTFSGIGTLSVTNGIGWADQTAGTPEAIDFAQPGTVLFLTLPPSGAMFMLR